MLNKLTRVLIISERQKQWSECRERKPTSALLKEHDVPECEYEENSC